MTLCITNSPIYWHTKDFLKFVIKCLSLNEKINIKFMLNFGKPGPFVRYWCNPLTFLFLIRGAQMLLPAISFHIRQFQPFSAYSLQFQHISACSSLIQHILAYSCLFQSILIYSSIFHPHLHHNRNVCPSVVQASKYASSQECWYLDQVLDSWDLVKTV